MKSRKRRYTHIIISCIILLGMILAAFILSGRLSAQVNADKQEQLAETIRKYTVQCYALEGAYPETIDYLEQHYTLHLDRDHYVYHYKFIGSNMMPEIQVFEKKQ